MRLTADEARIYGRNCVRSYNEYLKDIRKEIAKQALPQGSDNANRLFASHLADWQNYYFQDLLAREAVEQILS